MSIQKVTEENMASYALAIKMRDISAEATKGNTYEPKPIQSAVTKEMIQQYQDEQNKPIVIDGRLYKYHPATATVDLVELDPTKLERVLSNADIQRARLFLQAGAKDYARIRNNIIKLELEKRNNKNNLDVSIAAQKNKQIDNEISLRTREINELQLENRNLQQIIDDNEAKKQANEKVIMDVQQENARRIKRQEDNIKALNSGKLSVERQPAETEQEYLDRLNKIGTEPDASLELQAEYKNTEDFKAMLRQITKSESTIENVLKKLPSNDDRYLILKSNKIVVDEILKRFGAFNPRITEQDIFDAIHKIMTGIYTPPNKGDSGESGAPAAPASAAPVSARSKKPKVDIFKRRPGRPRIPDHIIEQLIGQSNPVGRPVDPENLTTREVAEPKLPPGRPPLSAEQKKPKQEKGPIGRRKMTEEVKQKREEVKQAAKQAAKEEKQAAKQAAKQKKEEEKQAAKQTKKTKFTSAFNPTGQGIQSDTEKEIKMLKKGFTQKEVPKYIQLGSVIILLKKLYYKNILAVKDLNMMNIKGFSNKPVSDSMVEIIMKLCSDEMPNKNLINNLSINEKHIFNTLIHIANLHKEVEHSKDLTINHLKDRIQLIEGEIQSGNNNPELLHELQIILYKLVHFNLISAHQAKKHIAQYKNYYLNP